MDPTSVVVAYADSPPLRETLGVLLERDCALRFLPSSAHADAAADADVAVVASVRPRHIIDALAHRWPQLPIVAVVPTPDDPGSRRPGLGDAADRVATVALEPHAIRAAVLRHRPEPADALATTVGVIAGTLQRDLRYAFTALRALADPEAVDTVPAAAGIVAAVFREQSHVVAEAAAHFHRFLQRPHRTHTSNQFAAALCRQLEAADALTATRGRLCRCTAAGCDRDGPLALVPLISRFVHAHLRRSCAVPPASVWADRGGITLRYRGRTPLRSGGMWPLLLAAFALQPWDWDVRLRQDGDEHVVQLSSAV